MLGLISRRCGLLLLTLATFFRSGSYSIAVAVDPYGPKDAAITIVVMDPMSAPLACDCVQGYAQRKYERLADYLAGNLKTTIRIVWSENLANVVEGSQATPFSVVIGKDSVVRTQAKEAKLDFQPLVQLTDKQGSVWQYGLFVVAKHSSVATVLDLEDHRILFGPADCDEKLSAPKRELNELDIPYQAGDECASCSIAAKKLMEAPTDEKLAGVISSYASPLLEGCGTIKKGDLKIIGQTKSVPFISVFVKRDFPAATRQALQQALLEMKSDDMLAAMETKIGFVEYGQQAPPESDASADQAKRQYPQ
jgi:ABC-type phosphate/phosphonate transport system substrate-binding protein